MWWVLPVAVAWLMWDCARRARAASRRIDEHLAAVDRDYPWRGAAFAATLDGALEGYEAVITRAFTTRPIPFSLDKSRAPSQQDVPR